MRTSMFIVAGLLLLAATVVLGRLFASNVVAAPIVSLIAFSVLWLAIAGANMWIGVAKAGYSISEELPIFALIVIVPVAIGGLLRWKGV